MEIYVVRPGDSIYAVARRYGINAQELARINQLSDPSRLPQGLALVIPTNDTAPRGTIEANAYAYPNISTATLEETLPFLTFLSPFAYRATLQGTILPINDNALIQSAYASGTAPLLTITNLDENETFSSDIAHAVFTDEAVQNALLEELFRLLREKGYYGVNMNFEYVYPFDKGSYSQFVRRLGGLLHERGYYFITTVAPKESGEESGFLYAAHDYRVHGESADRVVIMTYEWKQIRHTFVFYLAL